MSTARASAAVAVRFAAARLQDVEPAALDGELDVLHVAVVTLEPVDRRFELAVRAGNARAIALDRLGRARAGDDVLALSLDEELAVEPGLAGRRIAAEADAGRRLGVAVAEDHLHHVAGGPSVVGDAVLVRDRPAPVARSTTRRPRATAAESCSRGSCREVGAGRARDRCSRIASRRSRQRQLGIAARSVRSLRAARARDAKSPGSIPATTSPYIWIKRR